MKKSSLLSASSLGTIAAIALVTQPALAQENADGEGTKVLDAVVVTASGGDRTQIESAVSVTKVESEVISNFQPTSEAELFRLLPGIQVAGTAGPGGNANIAVRGLPVATGGSPFVQIQEDGLPTVLFGDIQFGNNDYWTNFDSTVESVEAVRGGTAGTYASQAPGAVINYISRTGEEEGGAIKFTRGLGFDESRVDFRYGGPITDTMRFHLGGYYKNGEGPLEGGYVLSDSFQVKGNVTQDLNEGRGYLRLNFKVADTQEPNYTGSPALANVGADSVSGIKSFPGFDGREQLNYSALNQNMLIYDRGGDLKRVPIDGITTEQIAIGGEFAYELSDNFNVMNRMRWSDISGGFASPFLNTVRTDSVIGSDLSINGTPFATVSEIRYADGPNAGQVFSDTYLDNNVNVRTNVRDLGSFVNDLAVSGNWDTEFGTITARVGYFYMSQDIAMDWHVNRSTRELSGDNASQLDLFDASGNQLTQQGISGYNNNWGNCCARDYDLNYTNEAPYIALDWENDRFVVDGSLRQDTVTATGSAIGGGSEFFLDPNGTIVGSTAADYVPGAGLITAMTSNGVQENLDYDEDYTSWTIGGLYKFNPDTSFFIRTSQGNRFNGDRQTLSGKINPDGSLNDAGRVAAVDEVNSTEIGVKNRGSLAGGDYSVELTYIDSDFSQSTFEINEANCVANGFPAGTGTCILDFEFQSKAVEFFGTYAIGDFAMTGTATWSDPEQKSPGGSFRRSNGIPDLLYSVAADYDFGEMVTFGLSATGQTNSVDGGGIEYPGGGVVNGFIKYRPFENVELGLDAYNLFDEFDFRGNGGVADGSVTPSVIGGAPAVGRTVRASLRYTF